MASKASVVFGSAPGTGSQKLRNAFWRAVRTLLQGVVGAFPAAGPGAAILSVGYWETVGYTLLAAVIAAFVAFLQNVITLLPQDPGQQTPT